MRSKPPNARFWFVINGDFVKLTLTPGQSLRIVHGGPTDEGSYYESRLLCYWDGRVWLDHYRRERDCDGLFESGGEYSAALDQLAAFQPFPDEDPPMPRWRTASEHQRDHTAERAGY